MSRFIKYIPDSEISQFLESKPLTNHLALIIAKRARRTKCELKELDAGECFLGDFKAFGLSEQEYRTAKKHLEKLNFATFRITAIVTAGVTKRVTVAKLVNTDVWDINETTTNGTNNAVANAVENATITLNKNDKKDYKNEKEENIYLGEFQKIAKGEILRTTQLDNNFHFGLFKKEWTENFQNEILKFWRHLETKKGDGWGTIGTLSGQLDAIKSYLGKFSELEIIESFDKTRMDGNISWNPEWVKNQKDKDKPKEPQGFAYDLPNFQTAKQREWWFFQKFEFYKTLEILENRLINTTYYKLAYEKRQPEKLIQQLETEFPKLLEHTFKNDRWQNIQ